MADPFSLKPCPKCNAACVPNATFCGKCGHNFSGGASASMPLAPAAYPALHYPSPMAMQAPAWRCMRCGYTGHGIIVRKMSTAGIIVMVLLLLFTVILFWIGLLMKETKIQCPQCGFTI